MDLSNISIIWIAIIIIAVLIDLATSSFLFIWIGGGALISLFANILGMNLSGQLVVFIISSVVFTAIGFPAAKKVLKTKVPKVLTMEESYIGREFEAKEVIKNEGRIMIDGVYWGVINKDELINVRDIFVITEIKGNKFLIKKK